MKRAVIFTVVVLAQSGCKPDPWEMQQLAQGTSSAELDRLAAGREVYANYCVGCHGENGDGNGAAASFLQPKPRDFRLGRLKFAAVASGDAPREDDYLRVVTQGLRGTSMPSFELLPESERRAVVGYVRSFYAKAHKERPGAPVSPGSDPWFGHPENGVAEGRAVYHGLASCWSCHPAYVAPAEIIRINTAAGNPAPGLRPNLYAAETKDSQWGTPIRAPDFLVDRIKNGLEVESLARVIASGVGGTAMPTWSGALTPRQIYGLAYYVRALALTRGTPESRALMADLQQAPIPAAEAPAGVPQ